MYELYNLYNSGPEMYELYNSYNLTRAGTARERHRACPSFSSLSRWSPGQHLEGRVFALYTGERWVEPEDGSPPWVTREK